MESLWFLQQIISVTSENFEEFPIQILLCDIDMPQGSGLELLEWLRNQEIQTECIFLSSYANFAYAQKALANLLPEYLLKPISNYELEQALEKVVLEITKIQGGVEESPCKKKNYGVRFSWKRRI